MTEEYRRKFQHMVDYDPANPSQLTETKRTDGWTNNLVEAKTQTKHTLNSYILKELREGRGEEYKNMLHFIPSVRSVLQLNEDIYGKYADFLKELDIDPMSLKNPDNAIRQVYNRFVEGKPQFWYLIDPQRYKDALLFTTKKLPYQREEKYWSDMVEEWADGVKKNILQFIANSILYSGKKSLGATRDEKDLWNTWFLLTGDGKIPHYNENGETVVKDENGNIITPKSIFEYARYFLNNYLEPFEEYIETSLDSKVGMSYETDSSVNPLLDKVAELYEKDTVVGKIVTFNKVMDIIHNRGSLSYLFVKGGKIALDKVGASPKDLKKYDKSMSPEQLALHNDRVAAINRSYSQWSKKSNS
jgi:hypothetical protein